VRETRGGTTTDLYYSPASQVLEERAGGLVQSQYVWSPGYVDALVERDRDTNADGTLDERLYAAHDANFNVTAVFDTSGNVVERYAYDPFGQATVLTPAFASRPSTLYAWDRLHQGLEYLSEIGLYADRARWLSPSLGRFTSVDPLGFGGGDANFYGYVGNGPTAGLDPSGLRDLSDVDLSSIGYAFYGGVQSNQVVDAVVTGASYIYDQLPDFGAGGGSGGSGGGGSGFDFWGVMDGARATGEHYERVGEDLENGDYEGALRKELAFGLGTEDPDSICAKAWNNTGYGRWLRAAEPGEYREGQRARPFVQTAEAYVSMAVPMPFPAALPARLGSAARVEGAALRATSTVARTERAAPAARPPINLLTETLTAEQQAVRSGRSLDEIIASAGMCFAAGTRLWTPTGTKPIEEFAEGDLILARDEFNPSAPVEARVVEAVLMRSAPVLHLHVGGRVIRTTDEHPFFAYEKGWVKARDLVGGDYLLGMDGEWTRLDEVYDTGVWDVMFNLRVGDSHTYFVGDEEWGFSVWTHNPPCLDVGRAARHGSPEHHAEMVRQAGLRHPDMPAGVAVRESRTNQALANPSNLNGPSYRRGIRPDNQQIGTDGRIYITEINRTGGIGYHAARERQMRDALGELFGGYQPVNLPR
jgi:RHS repeat-associated protein